MQPSKVENASHLSSTVVSLFAGGGISTLGAMQAGYKPVLAVEYDEDIAETYARNFIRSDSLRVADVRDVDYRPYAGATLLMASPVCTRASVANRNRGESELDISCGAAVARAIDEIRPRHVFIENVAQYKDFAAYKLITDRLDALGYFVQDSVLNAADFGVPQSRKRLILRASLDGYLPPLPTPTPRLGWYDAIADLLPTCEESALAPWQLKRLPVDFIETVLCDTHNVCRDATLRTTVEPAFTATQQVCGFRPSHMPRAILVEGTSAGDRPPQVYQPEKPSFTVCGGGGGRVHRVVFPDESPNQLSLFDADEEAELRALLFSGSSHTGAKIGGVRSDKDPAQTQTATEFTKRITRAFTLADCRVVSLTPRCMARFQTIPDTFILPDKRSLAATI
ncbi:MAG: DNA cytosine methyltransferase, partial [Armatimonadetes bacterium]|nr:DNA cytosine methyltransferase [Armatimonadota bacterium]